jgi:hypothetical protein
MDTDQTQKPQKNCFLCGLGDLCGETSAADEGVRATQTLLA